MTAASPPLETGRLAPVRSRHPLVALARAIYRSATGLRDATPIQVLFARAPRLLIGHLTLLGVAQYGTSIDARLRHLVSVWGSRVDGCRFCDDLETAVALRHGALSREEVDALPRWAEDPRFSERERAALRYVEEVNRTRAASDETFAALRPHFSEREIVEITWLNAVGTYLHVQAKAVGLPAPGSCRVPGA